jgi:predicted DNA-binding transcriptional regulator AlpA
MIKTKRYHIDRRAAVVADLLINGDPDEALNTRDAARLLGVSTQFLEIGRGRGTGPKFTRLSPRMIRYLRGDLVAWLRERAHSCTSEYRKSA